MKTFEFNNEITSDKLNESMFKQFGTRIDFNKYSREDLENYRNLLRTKVTQVEGSTGFNDLLANESYQKDKYMLSLLNTKIKEMLGEGKKNKDNAMKTKKVIDKKAVSKKVKEGFPTVDDAKKAAAEKGTAGMKVGDTQKSSTGGTITKTEKGLKHVSGKNYGGSSAPKTPDSDKKVKEAAEKKETTWTDKSGKKHPAIRVTGKNYTGKEAEKEAKDKKIKEGIRRAHYAIIIEGLQKCLREDEEGKAKDITAGSDMVNDFTSWMQRVGQYQTKSMIELADSIRANFGQAESDAFKNSVQIALQETLSALTQARETITRAVAVLAGEEIEQEPMGQEPVDTDLDAASPDSMNTSDEFGASDAAGGGAETAGREMREHAELRRIRKLDEAHSLITKLSI